MIVGSFVVLAVHHTLLMCISRAFSVRKWAVCTSD